MSQNLQTLAEQLLDAAQKAGADAADAITVQGTSLSIDVREGKLEQAERSEGLDLGLRVFVGQRQANVSVSDARPETITTMAERAQQGVARRDRPTSRTPRRGRCWTNWRDG